MAKFGFSKFLNEDLLRISNKMITTFIVGIFQ